MKVRFERGGRISQAALARRGRSLLQNIVIYVFVTVVGFVFLYPLLHMISYSFMSGEDLMNPLTGWIPASLYTENYARAFRVLDYGRSLAVTVFVSVLPAMLQTAVCAVAGYGLARYEFRGKKLIFAMVLATFIIPPQITMIPQYLMYRDLKLLNSVMAYLLPAAFGQGFKSAIFILIFYQFFKQVPRSLEEAAQVDGAGAFRIFWKVAVPIAAPGFIISFLLSVVWYWNETYLASMYLGASIRTLPIKLSVFAASFKQIYQSGGAAGQTLNEAVKMAGTCLNILPLLVLYFLTQRWFVEGIDKSGITGE